MKVDLHIHSTFSDGTLTVPQIVEFARENNFEKVRVKNICSFSKAYLMNVLS